MNHTGQLVHDMSRWNYITFSSYFPTNFSFSLLFLFPRNFWSKHLILHLIFRDLQRTLHACMRLGWCTISHWSTLIHEVCIAWLWLIRKDWRIFRSNRHWSRWSTGNETTFIFLKILGSFQSNLNRHTIFEKLKVTSPSLKFIPIYTAPEDRPWWKMRSTGRCSR